MCSYYIMKEMGGHGQRGKHELKLKEKKVGRDLESGMRSKLKNNSNKLIWKTRKPFQGAYLLYSIHCIFDQTSKMCTKGQVQESEWENCTLAQ